MRHRHGTKATWRLGHYLRARLRRRLFVWFGASILVTGLFAGALAWLVQPGGGWWEKNLENLRTFASHRYAEVWDEPAARDRLTRDLASDFDLRITLLDRDGTVLARHGEPCDDAFIAPLLGHDGRPLGELRGCIDHMPGHRPFLLYFLVGATVLWAASGVIAMRLTRPLAQLVHVTRQIGAGKLDARMHLPRFGHNELQVIAEAINDMAARIEKQIADQRELLAAVSHEIRTPLGHVRVLLDLAGSRGADPALVRELERELVAIDGLVDQLLASSRVEFGNLERRELDGVQLGLRALERAGLDPTLLDADAETAPLSADAALLLQALANLLRNASEHGGGPTTLRVRCSPDEVVFEVDDDGPGFPPGDLDAVFDAFHRGPTSKARAGSLGLGLALVRRIAQAHGGRASASNPPGGGARVAISIPVRAPDQGDT
jgi:two-component system, OmpR family, sensor kinase